MLRGGRGHWLVLEQLRGRMPANWASSSLHGFVVVVGENVWARGRQVRLLKHLLRSLNEDGIIHHCPSTLLYQVVSWTIIGARGLCYSHGVPG